MGTNFQITPSPVTVQNTEFNFSNLYLFHIGSGQNRNQFLVTSKDPAIPQLGEIVVNNWAIRDGPDTSSPIVARAQGLHILAGNWNNVFSIVFEIESFRGSTLEVQGISVEQGEYAIVGGTGKFAMARGIIYKRLHKKVDGGDIIQLTVRGFFPVLQAQQPPPPAPAAQQPPPRPAPVVQQPPPRPAPVVQPPPPPPAIRVSKIGLYGGNGGRAWDIPDTPSRLESITVYYGGIIDAIQFSYTNQYGQVRNSGRWGGQDGRTASRTITLEPSEFVKEVSGTIGSFGQYNNIIRNLKFVTSFNRTYGPFGNQRPHQSSPFTIPVPNNSRIVGFFARGQLYLDAIGVYVQV